MTIGLIFECGPQGADKQVCEYLAKHLTSDAAISTRTLDNKENLLRDGGRVASQLLKDGCSRVLVIWDLRPAWPDKTNKPCRARERQQILASLEQTGLQQASPVYLICIEQELESWLLASDHAIAALLSTAAHRYSVSRTRRPDQVMQPKAAMIKHFNTARGFVYDDKVDAIRVLKAAAIDLRKLRRSASFSRFESKLGLC